MSTVFDTTDLDTTLNTKDVPLSLGRTVLHLCFIVTAVVTSFAMGYVPWYMDGSAWSVPILILINLVLIVVPEYYFLPYYRRNTARMERESATANWRAHIAGSVALSGIGPWILIGALGLGLDAAPRFTVEAAAKTVLCAVATVTLLNAICFITSFALGVFGDSWVFLSSVGFTTAWYFLSHDPLLKLPHYYHHAQCDSRYTAYVPVRQSYDPKDKIRCEVFKIRAKERAMATKN